MGRHRAHRSAEGTVTVESTQSPQRGPRRPIGWRKRILYSLLPLVLVATAVEVVGRCVAYQRESKHTFAVVGMFDALLQWRRDAHIETVREEFLADRNAELAGNAKPPSPSQLEHSDRYTMIFDRFVKLCQAADATVAVMFIPSPGEGNAPLNRITRAFFQDLCSTRDIPLFDATETFAPYDDEVVYLMPDDGHTSRFGNRLLAQGLAGFVRPLLDHRSTVTFTEQQRPALLGDLKPDQNYIFWDKAPLPCRVVTNAQGLRRVNDLAFPKSHPRILCVGDSYTFGHAVHNSHCYPQILETLLDDAEVINSGIAGYTLCDEYAYFSERGRFTEPDLVLLQVFPNDFEGFAPSLQKVFCRGGEFCPAPGERR